jgi:hypothetical protein
MTLSRIGGLAALTCATTYLIGFALLVTLLAPLGFGTGEIDPAAVVAFIDARTGLMIAWNTTIYVLNALALALLVVAFAERLAPLPGWAAVTRAFGLIWATLVLGAGMIANVGVERAAHLYPQDPGAAADLWATMHAVENGLGGGNEIAGGVWIASVSLAGMISRSLPRPVAWLGLATGLGGLVTLVPALGDAAGAVFGLGAIGWFLGVGVALLAARSDVTSDPLVRPS